MDKNLLLEIVATNESLIELVKKELRTAYALTALNVTLCIFTFSLVATCKDWL